MPNSNDIYQKKQSLKLEGRVALHPQQCQFFGLRILLELNSHAPRLVALPASLINGCSITFVVLPVPAFLILFVIPLELLTVRPGEHPKALFQAINELALVCPGRRVQFALSVEHIVLDLAKIAALPGISPDQRPVDLLPLLKFAVKLQLVCSENSLTVWNTR